jgi:hypothetical protein
MPLRLPTDLIEHLATQRRRISALSKKSEKLRRHGRILLAESNCLAGKLERSAKNLADTYLANKAAANDIQNRSSCSATASLTKSRNGCKRVLADSPDMVEALELATEILKMEFSETEGSGRQTLVKCEQVLERTRSSTTIELRLY